VLVLASQKGGSGKTTLSGHLAVEAEAAGIGQVALIDTDPQGSLSEWWNSRATASPRFVKVGLAELGSALGRLKETGLKLAVIDTPPAITASISSVVAHADLVLIPTRPSPHDLRAVTATVEIAETHRRPLMFVVNGATARAKITSEAAVALSQHGTVAPVTIHHRVDFAASMVDGRTVGEVAPKSQSAKEVRELWAYVQDRLYRLARDPSLVPQSSSANFSLGPLSAYDAASLAGVQADTGESPDMVRASEAPEQAVPQRANIAEGTERRLGLDRRQTLGAGPHGTTERRVAHPFGRRNSDVPFPVR
jgi:chromosome partitioning protein